jgi:hypothetical protein
VTKNHPEMNADKIYLDAYPQTATAGGIRFPEINAAIDDKIQRGALIINYVGHGGEVGVAEERVITIPQIQSWSNKCNLNLFVSATCEFTKYDDPSRVSAGEWAFLNPTGGAIALMTTTRSVFYGVNSETGRNFYSHVFERDANFKAQTFGEIIRKTKNQTTSSTNKRSFTFTWDWLPSLDSHTIDNRKARDYIKNLAFTSRVKVLMEIKLDHNEESELIYVYINDYSENLIRRDPSTGCDYYNVSLSVEES